MALANPGPQIDASRVELVTMRRRHVRQVMKIGYAPFALKYGASV